MHTPRTSSITVPHRTGTERRRWLGWLCAAALLCPHTGYAQGVRFDVPPQSLGTALDSLAKEVGLQILYPPEAVEGLTTRGVQGEYTPQEAIKRLLDGTGLRYEFLKDNTVTVSDAANAKPEEDITLPEIIVTATPLDDTGYSVFNATTATKTDTPIMETPVSIQVVPRAVLDDQQVISVLDALKNVSGVQPSTFEFYDGFILRGFDAGGHTYRDGLPQRFISFLETANLERIEVLKGPAAMLFGRVEPGGIINLVTNVTKRPLEEAYYSLQQQFGSYDLYRTTVDATGPVLADRSLLYRMNIAYKDNDSFRDFVSREHIFVAPSLTLRPTERLEFNLDLEYQHDEFVEDGSDIGIPAIGNRPAPIPISRYLGDAVLNREHPNTQERVLAGFNWSYRFNDDWKLTNRSHYNDADYDQTILFFLGLRADNHTVDRGLWHQTDFSRTAYATNIDLTGRFTTGILEHAVLVGFDYYRRDEQINNGILTVVGVPPTDTFNPVYGLDLASLTAGGSNHFTQSHDQWYGAYFQDQITLWDKLHILGGGRYD